VAEIPPRRINTNVKGINNQGETHKQIVFVINDNPRERERERRGAIHEKQREMKLNRHDRNLKSRKRNENITGAGLTRGPHRCCGNESSFDGFWAADGLFSADSYHFNAPFCHSGPTSLTFIKFNLHLFVPRQQLFLAQHFCTFFMFHNISRCMEARRAGRAERERKFHSGFEVDVLFN
jgi:hypothetical protein